mmetsp:Transcript_2677/g.2743  ORF Transcript_2677/g.2743 Transcript_2677/m.2743 type:complete len:217 (+) Transcript_2677:27-677(+)
MSSTQKKQSDNIEFSQVDFSSLDKQPHRSILDHIPNLMKTQLTGNILMDEMAVWGMIHEQKLFESKDIKEMKSFIKRAVKLSLIAMVTGTVLNRRITKLKLRNKQFLDLSILVKFPIRLGIFAVTFYMIALNPLFKHFIRLHYYMNYKYSDRYRRFNEVGDPLIMNPLFLTDPSYTSEEAEVRKMLFERVRSQTMMMIMEGKEMEKMMKQQKNGNI